jgi:hypothetical protein
VDLPYLESSFAPQEILPGMDEFGVTLVKPMQSARVLEVVVVTQANPKMTLLANEAVNALLPRWLIEEGVDMYAVYSKPMGGASFRLG